MYYVSNRFLGLLTAITSIQNQLEVFFISLRRNGFHQDWISKWSLWVHRFCLGWRKNSLGILLTALASGCRVIVRRDIGGWSGHFTGLSQVSEELRISCAIFVRVVCVFVARCSLAIFKVSLIFFVYVRDLFGY